MKANNLKQHGASLSLPARSEATPRRVFMMQALVACAAVGTVSQVKAQTMLSETDPQAVSLGYKADATKVDKTKFPKYAAGQLCSNCALYQGKAGDAAGGCPLFAGKRVAGAGWCSAYAKKASTGFFDPDRPGHARCARSGRTIVPWRAHKAPAF